MVGVQGEERNSGKPNHNSPTGRRKYKRRKLRQDDKVHALH